MLPLVTPINVLHGSAPVADTCLVRSREAVWSATTTEADAVFPFPPCVEVTALVVLSFVPAVAPVTVTLKLQLALAASAPPLKAIAFGAVVVREPPHVDVGPLVATVKPAGNVSVKPMPLSAEPMFGFVIVNVSVDVFPVKMDAGENDLARTGGAITVRDAVA